MVNIRHSLQKKLFTLGHWGITDHYSEHYDHEYDLRSNIFQPSAALFGQNYLMTLNLKLEVNGIMLTVSGIIGTIQNETKIIKTDQGVSEL